MEFYITCNYKEIIAFLVHIQHFNIISRVFHCCQTLIQKLKPKKLLIISPPRCALWNNPNRLKEISAQVELICSIIFIQRSSHAACVYACVSFCPSVWVSVLLWKEWMRRSVLLSGLSSVLSLCLVSRGLSPELCDPLYSPGQVVCDD